jgi:hypothetical protein
MRGPARLGAVDDTDAAVIAAVISLIVALITSVATALVARQQVRAQLNEVTQAQFADILAKRIEVYPDLWRLIQSATSDTIRTGVPPGRQWAEQLFQGITRWHARNGVFLTQGSYDRYNDFRAATLEIYLRCRAGGHPAASELQALDAIWSGTPGQRGLATELKNDLGSYRAAAVSVT